MANPTADPAIGIAAKPALSSFPRRRESIAILIVDSAHIAGMI